MKKLFSLLLIPFVFSISAGAKTTDKPSQPKQNKAHVHGSAKVGIAFEENYGKVTLEAPAESIVGFEFVPKSAKDQKRQSEQLEKLDKSISEMIVFDESLKCVFTSGGSDINRSGDHADLKTSFEVKCNKTPKDTVVKFNFQKVFPKLKTVEVQALISELQLSTTVKKDNTSLELKNP